MCDAVVGEVVEGFEDVRYEHCPSTVSYCPLWDKLKRLRRDGAPLYDRMVLIARMTKNCTKCVRYKMVPQEVWEMCK